MQATCESQCTMLGRCCLPVKSARSVWPAGRPHNRLQRSHLICAACDQAWHPSHTSQATNILPSGAHLYGGQQTCYLQMRPHGINAGPVTCSCGVTCTGSAHLTVRIRQLPGWEVCRHGLRLLQSSEPPLHHVGEPEVNVYCMLDGRLLSICCVTLLRQDASAPVQLLKVWPPGVQETPALSEC